MKNIISILLFVLVPLVIIGQTTDENYIQTTTYQVETTTGSVADDNKIETLTYYDGLGRPLQSIAARAGSSRENIVTYMEYDEMGLQPKEYLPWATPYPGSHENFIDQDDLKSDILSFYNTVKYENTLNPYSEISYERSPLFRTDEQGAAGNPWKVVDTLDTDRTIKFEYLSNGANEVYQFSVSLSGGYFGTASLQYDGFYPENKLFKWVTKDENWQPGDGNNRTSQEFTDVSGRVVLKRTFNNNVAHDTHYVYDTFGNLTFVLSPEASEDMVTGGALSSNAQVLLDNLSYQYRYDHRNRLIWKKLPGKAYEEIVYDKLDRPIMTQDGLQRIDNRWVFTKYDQVGRVTYTGAAIVNDTRANIEAAAASLDDVFEVRGTSLNVAGTTMYYTNNSYPTTIEDVLTINYYDSYEDTDGLSVTGPNAFGEPTTADLNGLSTVSKVRVLGVAGQKWNTTVTGYDHKGRAIVVKTRDTYLDTTDEIHSLLDFTGKPLETLSTHLRETNEVINIRDYFTYDHAGRLLTHEQKIDDESVQLIAENEYDELGQLVRKNVGGETFIDGYTDITNAVVTPQGVISKENTTTGWDAGAKTRGEIMEDGGIQIEVSQLGELRFGIQNVTNQTNNWEEYDFGMELGADNGYGTGDVFFILDGVLQTTAATTYTSGDVLSVERNGTQVEFRKNGGAPLDTDSIGADALVGKIGLHDATAGAKGFVLFGNNIDNVLQEVDYAYNVRGWLTDINDVDALPFGLLSDLFNFRINYTVVEDHTNNPMTDATPLYNGNIAQTIWKNVFGDEEKRSYGYAYDDLNRIQKAYSRKGASLENKDDFTMWNGNYDRNGNLQSLRRSGEFASTMWDDLLYNYIPDTNQLLNVVDVSPCSCKDEGYNDAYIGQTDFVYDINGNMTVDNNKDITSISYNHLNLPTQVMFASGDHIDYIYDATGVKLRKLLTVGSSVTKTDYAGNYMYLDNNLEFFNHPEGYVMVVAGTGGETKGFKGGETTTTTFEYVFQFKDHLGNIRLSYSDADQNGSIAISEIIEESNYFPFGLKQWGYNNTNVGGNDLAQQWKFGGKQLSEELGIMTYDFGARNYDPALGRWFVVDALAEHDNQIDKSPYAYAWNNPVFFTDPDGNCPSCPGFNWLLNIVQSIAQNPDGVTATTVPSQGYNIDGVTVNSPEDILADGSAPAFYISGVPFYKTTGLKSISSAVEFSLPTSRLPRIKGISGKGKKVAEETTEVAEELLPGELEVGSYKDLIKAGEKGDNITPHHMPANDFMKSKGVSKGDGVSMNMEQPSPGKGGRHRRTASYGRKSDLSLTARQSLARDIMDARKIYQQDRLYGQKVRDALQDVIRQNIKRFPELFIKQ